MTRAAVIVQRYGDEVIGGAESLCLQVVEKLTQELGWDVTVYTSCAVDYVTWKNAYRAGETILRGVKIKRFPILFPRYVTLFRLFNRIVAPLILTLGKQSSFLRRCAYELEKVWIILQGPYCPALTQAIKSEAQQYDRVVLFTYLYYPTLYAAKVLQQKFAIVPTAHDEPPFYFQHVANLLEKSAAILVNVLPEKELIEARLGYRLKTIQLAGLGFTFDAIRKVDSAEEYSIPDSPFVLYLGRQSKAKGLDKLIENFSAFVQKNPGTPLKLVLLGRRDPGFRISESDRIVDLGHVSQEQKVAIIRASLCVINPSSFESLSMIVIEAMLCEKPLLLNCNSPVLEYYCLHTTSCFGYRSPDEFCSQLKHITTMDWSVPEGQQHLVDTRSWAERNFSWDAVLKVYAELYTKEMPDAAR